MTILFTVDALDANNVEETLRFSDGKYIDGSGIPYEPYIADAPIISVMANDGGLFDMFSERSIGDIALHNIDGSLNYLADYAVDGRTAIVSWFDGATVTQRFIGTVGGMNDANDQVIFSLKALQEALNIKHPMGVYAGTNMLPVGIEGTDDTIKGNNKPKVLGDCRNISAVLVNSSLLIYQVSSRDDCRITAVYDEGVLLAHNQVHGLHGVGEVSIAVDSHGIDTVDIAAGAEIMFSNHKTIYTVQTGSIAGVIVLASGLTSSVPNNAYIEVVNFYADAAALQYTDYFVDGNHSKGDATIAIVSSVEAININVGDQIIFGSHLAWYTVQVGLADGVIVIEEGLLEDINDGDIVQVVGVKNPAFWGGFQGYFRPTAKPLGTVTCDAVSINDSGLIHKAGDVFELVAAEAGLAVDSGSVTEFNTAGVLGLYISGNMTTKELFNKIAVSVAGYYHFIGSIIYLNLLAAPTSVADFVIDDSQVVSIDRSAKGLGDNDLPIYGIHCKYDRIETVQNEVAGYVPSARRQRLKSQYRLMTDKDDAVLTRHRLSIPLEIESLLRYTFSASDLLSRLLPIVKVRRDVVTVIVPRSETPVLVIGSTGQIITPKLGYSSGRQMVLIGYTIDDSSREVKLLFYG